MFGMKSVLSLGSLLFALCFLWPDLPAGAQDLQVSYGNNGIQTLSYRGIVLEDVGQSPADAFHIWHMKSSDLQGNPNTIGQYGWGESNNGRSWNASNQTMTYYFIWGSIQVQFAQNGNNLNMTVTESNNANSGILFDGAEVYPLALHFPQDPLKFYGYSQYAITTTGPGVSVADFGSGVVTSVIPNESMALYGGWKSAGNATYSPLMTSTAPDGLATFLPRNDLPVQPGSSLTYTVSLRFTPEGTAADASDAYSSFAATYPSQMTWTDKRIIGTAYLSSSSTNSNINQSAGFPTNPRRYFNDPNVDVTTAAGLNSFQQRVLQQARTNVATLQTMSGQGVMTWDIEGEQYPQSTSYVCSPDQVAVVAPEMESIVTDPTSPYAGRKLDDAYFQTMTDAGAKVGVCLRPQAFVLNSDGTAAQHFLSGNAAIIAGLEKKVQFASSRWKATMFYVDSTVDVNGGTLDPAIFQQLITDFPNFLFIPEESTPRYYAYSAPFYSFLFHTDLGTPQATYNVYPKAFGANLINDVSSGTLAAYRAQLTQSVVNGDILMGHADYPQENDATLVAIYQAAGVGISSPVKQTPAISWNQPGSIQYGTQLSGAQLNATAGVAGTFSYSPAAGSTPGAGVDTLTTVFTPSDTASYNAATASTSLTVSQASPVINWSASASLVAGTPLSSTQLNATANVAGSFSYTPGVGTVLPVGNSNLSAVFTPADQADYSIASSSVGVSVNAVAQQTPQISWTAPVSVAYGTALSGVQLNAISNVAGSFQYSPAPGAVLNAGSRTLVAVFTPNDSTTWTTAVASVPFFVMQGTPNVSWSSPAPLAAGTALSGAQLNAVASVPGTFDYSPAAGVVPSVGTDLLQVTFSPSDSVNYVSQSASVPLVVNAPASANVNLGIVYPAAGQTVSGVINVVGVVNLYLDAAGSFLIVDGQWQDQHRVTGGPYLYLFDTTTLSNGSHTLQLWGHDIGNNTTLSSIITVVVAN